MSCLAHARAGPQNSRGAGAIEIHGFQGLLAATIMAGLILLLLGYMRFGTYIKYIPHSVPVGFTTGIAVILFASQMKELLGLRIAHEPAAFLPKLYQRH